MQASPSADSGSRMTADDGFRVNWTSWELRVDGRIGRILRKAGVKKLDVESDNRHVEVGGALKQASGIKGTADGPGLAVDVEGAV